MAAKRMQGSEEKHSSGEACSCLNTGRSSAILWITDMQAI
jgi:hypothetical protein